MELKTHKPTGKAPFFYRPPPSPQLLLILPLERVLGSIPLLVIITIVICKNIKRPPSLLCTTKVEPHSLGELQKIRHLFCTGPEYQRLSPPWKFPEYKGRRRRCFGGETSSRILCVESVVVNGWLFSFFPSPAPSLCLFILRAEAWY